MLYSILSQINKGLRRIDVLRKSEIGRSPQRFEQYFSIRGVRIFHPVYNSTGNGDFSPVCKTGFFSGTMNKTKALKNDKTRTKRRYGGLLSEIVSEGIVGLIKNLHITRERNRMEIPGMQLVPDLITRAGPASVRSGNSPGQPESFRQSG